MTFHDLERAVWAEIKKITGRKKLRFKDIMFWSSGEEVTRKECEPGEEVVYCPDLGVWAVIPKEKT